MNERTNECIARQCDHGRGSKGTLPYKTGPLHRTAPFLCPPTLVVLVERPVLFLGEWFPSPSAELPASQLRLSLSVENNTKGEKQDSFILK